MLNARPADDALAIRRGLARAVEAHRLTRAQASRYRTILANTRATLPELPSTRRTVVANVLRLVRLQASHFNAPRALALFTMLDKNARYLRGHGMPANGTDVTGPDGVVYRAGWGYGLQFHPLANVVALNLHAAAGRRTKALALARALVARAVPRKEGRVWEYYFPYGGGSPPWTAEMPQAVGAQAFARAGALLERPNFFTAARRAYRAIQGTGLLMSTGNGPWVQHYSFSSMMVLNAQLQSIISLTEYADVVGSDPARRLANRLEASARASLGRFDTGYWTNYIPGAEAPLNYHEYHVTLTRKLANRTGREFWANAHGRFNGYTHEPPLVRPGRQRAAIYPWPADGFRDSVVIGFWVSKISTVTIRVGGERFPLGVVTGGWHRITWSPGRREPRTYQPRAVATDLAGNAATHDLAPITIAKDTTAPVVRAHVEGRRLVWRVTDGATPWITLRLRLTRAGNTEVIDLGRRSLSGSLRMPLPRGTWQAVLVVRDSSGNRTRHPLGPVPAPQ